MALHVGFGHPIDEMNINLKGSSGQSLGSVAASVASSVTASSGSDGEIAEFRFTPTDGVASIAATTDGGDTVVTITVI